MPVSFHRGYRGDAERCLTLNHCRDGILGDAAASVSFGQGMETILADTRLRALCGESFARAKHYECWMARGEICVSSDIRQGRWFLDMYVQKENRINVQ